MNAARIAGFITKPHFFEYAIGLWWRILVAGHLCARRKRLQSQLLSAEHGALISSLYPTVSWNFERTTALFE
jgi:hypothetical protein